MDHPQYLYQMKGLIKLTNFSVKTVYENVPLRQKLKMKLK